MLRGQIISEKYDLKYICLGLSHTKLLQNGAKVLSQVLKRNIYENL